MDQMIIIHLKMVMLFRLSCIDFIMKSNGLVDFDIQASASPSLINIKVLEAWKRQTIHFLMIC